MSLSKLSSQLASLHASSAASGGAVAGVAVASSNRKHSDSIGRGLHHSVNHGHSVGLNRNQRVHFKPSVLHPDAHSAARADIPITTLRENAVLALQYIRQRTNSPLFDLQYLTDSQKYLQQEQNRKETQDEKGPIQTRPLWITLLGPHSVQYERGINTAQYNKALSDFLDDSFVLLSSMYVQEDSGPSSTENIMMLHPGSRLTTCVLHVLEYITLLYYPHVYNAESLLLSFLPHHETALFQRIIQLIDLATLPQWSFLRPYTSISSSTTGHDGDIRSFCVPRNVIAKWVASSNDNGSGNGILFGLICRLAKNAARVHFREIMNRDQSMTNSKTVPQEYKQQVARKGISFMISFSAAVIVEAMCIQNKTLGSLAESTVRTLLPHILDALGPDQDQSSSLIGDPSTENKYYQYWSYGSICPDWRSFGHILASILNDKCELDSSVIEVLATTAIYGSIEATKYIDSRKRISEEEKLVETDRRMNEPFFTSSPTVAIVETTADSLIMIMSLVGRSTEGVIDEKTISRHYLPLVTLPIRKGVPPDMMGCTLPESTFYALKKLRALPAALSYLYDQRDVDIRIFLSSLTANCIFSIRNQSVSMAGSNKTQLNDNVQLLTALIQENSIKGIWANKMVSLCAAACTYTLITFASNLEESQDEADNLLPLFNAVLSALQMVDPIGFDVGICYAVSSDCYPCHLARGQHAVSRLVLLLSTLGEEYSRSIKASAPFAYHRTNWGDVAEQIHDTVVGNDSPNRAVEQHDTVTTTHWDDLLPARIALEHPDPNRRLLAIDRLMLKSTRASTNDDMADSNDDLGEALIRRFAIDDDVTVVASAARAIMKLSSNETVFTSFFQEPYIAEQVAQGLCRRLIKLEEYEVSSCDSGKLSPRSYPSLEKNISRDSIDALSVSLQLSASVLRYNLMLFGIDHDNDDKIDDMGSQGSLNYQLHLIAQILFLHLSLPGVLIVDDEDVTNNVQNAAGKALWSVVSEDSSSYEGPSNDCMKVLMHSQLTHFVLRNSPLSLQHPSHSHDNVLRTIRKGFLSVLIRLCPDLIQIQESTSDLLVRQIVDFMQTFTETDSEISLRPIDVSLLNLLLSSYAKKQITTKKTNNLVDFLMRLCSFRSVWLFENASRAIFTNVIEEFERLNLDGAFIVTALELASRPLLEITAVQRLLQLVTLHLPSTFKANAEERLITCVTIFTLALIGHSNLAVRQMALELLKQIKQCSDATGDVGHVIAILSNVSTDAKTDLLMHGTNALHFLLRHLLQSARDRNSIHKFLTAGCVLVATTFKSFLSAEYLELTDGSCHASSSVLEALRNTGEKLSPLLSRWKEAGSSILLLFLSIDNVSHFPYCAIPLLDSVLIMLKALTVHTEDNSKDKVLTTIPTDSDNRSRSHSVTDTPDGLAFIDKYPDDMKKAIVSCLDHTLRHAGNKCAVHLCERLCSLVLESSSWRKFCFAGFDSSYKRKIGLALLSLKSVHLIDKAGSALVCLPLDVNDVIFLLKSINFTGEIPSNHFASVTLLADLIKDKADFFATDLKLPEMISTLFDYLSVLSNASKYLHTGHVDASDYARYAILQALVSMMEVINPAALYTAVVPSQRKRRKDTYNIDIDHYGQLLVGLIGGDNNTDIIPMISGQGKTLALTLLASLCSAAPGSIVTAMLQAMISRIVLFFVRGDRCHKLSAVSNIFAVVIPAYCRHASSAGLSLIDAFRSIILNCISESGEVSWDLLATLFIVLLDSLTSLSESKNGQSLASVVAIYIAAQVFFNQNYDSDLNERIAKLLPSLLSHAATKDKFESYLFILRYAGNTMESAITNKCLCDSSEHDFMSVSIRDLIVLCCQGPGVKVTADLDLSNITGNSLQILSLFLVEIVISSISSDDMMRFIMNASGLESELCLKLWQELVSLQSKTSQYRSSCEEDNQQYLDRMANSSSEGLSMLQKVLPVPLFLASVSSIINDDDADPIMRKKAIAMFARRSTEIDPTSSEATLFIENTSDLIDILSYSSVSNGRSHTNNFRASILLQQASLSAIEQVTRSFGFAVVEENVMKKRSSICTMALQQTIRMMKEASLDLSILSNGQVQLLSSTALCCSTLVSILNTRCVPLLHTLIKPIIYSLTSANNWLKMQGAEGSTMHDAIEAIQLLQLSLIRVIYSIVESLPQFMGPYLAQLLAPSCLSSTAVRNYSVGEYSIIRETALSLDELLATKAPCRLILPALCETIFACFTSQHTNCEPMWREALSVYRILKLVISKTPRSDLIAVSGKIVNVFLQAYAYDCSNDIRTEMLSMSNESILELVMKLSEAQLRPLYAKLREWRGDLVGSTSDRMSSLRRQSFWSLSAVLCNELRSIFLPCLTFALSDALQELELAVSILCTPIKAHDGDKRRKLEVALDVDHHVFSALQPLLLCLEYAFKADAQEGGGWVRQDEGQRYHSILKPLGQLLQSNIPLNFPVESNLSSKENSETSQFSKVVRGVGTEEYGNVVGCLTSLAVAAGNEQLWKPLNHSILEACSNETRPEVRKAGVSALLSIIQTLGEEYMILLPECLPTLSELLEDDDEEIVALAKECIRQGETLLGESLEDNLR